MNSKNGIIGAVIVIVIAIAAFMIIEDANDGPLENAAEDMEDAAEEIADDLNG